MGAALASQLRAPTGGSCMGWIARQIMASGKGIDSIHAVQQISSITTIASKPVIIELGPGQGYSLREMMASFQPSRTYAIEISDAFREILVSDKELSLHIDSGILSVHDNDAKKLDFIANNSVDLIFAFNVIYFLDPLNVYMKEMLRVLKPGGCLMCGVKPIAKDMDKEVYINTDWEKIQKELKSCGFVDVVLGDEQLEGPVAYIPMSAKKP